MGVTSYKKRAKLALLDKTNSIFWVAIGRTSEWPNEAAPPVAAPGDLGLEEPICYVRPQTISLCKLVDTGEDVIHKGNKYAFVTDANAVAEDARFLYLFARFDPTSGQPYANFRQVAVYDGLRAVAGHESDLWLAPSNVDSPGQWEYLDNDVVTTMTSSRIQVIELVVEIR
jgi:hypothetical protein